MWFGSGNLGRWELIAGVLVLASSAIGLLGAAFSPTLRRPAAIKAIVTTTTVAGCAAFIVGLIGMIERQPVGQWLPILVAGLLSDAVAAAVPRMARARQPHGSLPAGKERGRGFYVSHSGNRAHRTLLDSRTCHRASPPE